MLEAMARIAPPQPSEAMARIPPRLVPQPNGKQRNLACFQLFIFGVDSRFETACSSLAFNFVALCSCFRNLGSRHHNHHQPVSHHRIPQL
jgi:hypothetical protein